MAGSAGAAASVEAQRQHELMSEVEAAISMRLCVFPMPPIPRPPLSRSRSRRCRHRLGRATALWAAAERSRATLNSLWVGVPACTTNAPSLETGEKIKIKINE